MNKPLVSIIINNYNYAHFLREAIDSCLNQTYPDVEVLVVDDESTDNSREIITSYGQQVIPVFKPNGGQGSALNAGFDKSQGDIIIFLDADDYLFPQTAEQVVLAWKPNLSHLQYRLDLVDATGKYLDVYPKPEIPFDSGNVVPLLLERGRYRATVTSGNAFNREVLEKIMPIPEQEFFISADGYLVTVAPLHGEVRSLDQSLGARRQHGSNLWAQAAAGMRPEKLRKSVEHDFLRYKYLGIQAAAQGYTLSDDPGLRDATHLTSRIASLRLDPQNHPVEHDSCVNLAFKGYRAIWQYTRLPWKRKLFLSHWFLWVGLLPQSAAEPAIAWLLAANARPKVVDSVLKKIRALTR